MRDHRVTMFEPKTHLRSVKDANYVNHCDCDVSVQSCHWKHTEEYSE